MFEMWADKAEPSVRMVIARGGALPMDLGPRDWLPLGAFDASPETAAEVNTRGFAFIHSAEPLPEGASLTDSNAAGA